MAISNAEVQAALGEACQLLKASVTGFEQMIASLKSQIRVNEDALTQLLAVTNPDQATTDQIAQLSAMQTTLQNQLTLQQDGLQSAEGRLHGALLLKIG